MPQNCLKSNKNYIPNIMCILVKNSYLLVSDACVMYSHLKKSKHLLNMYLLIIIVNKLKCFIFSKIFLDSIFSSSKDFLLVYKNLPDTSKDQLMNIISIWLDHYNEEVSLEVIVVIKNNFFINCALDKITRHVVNVLAKASSIEKFNAEIKKHTTLLKKIMGRYKISFIMMKYGL